MRSTVANGRPAFGQYRPSGPGGRHEPWALQVLEIAGGRIVEFHAFLDTEQLFPAAPRPYVLNCRPVGQIAPHETVVVFNTGTGLKYR